MLIVSSLGAIMLILLDWKGITEKELSAMAIVIGNVIAYFVGKYKGGISAIHFFFFVHGLVFITTLFAGFGRVCDLIMFPTLMCWAAVSFSDRRYFYVAAAFLTLTVCGAIYTIRNGVRDPELMCSTFDETMISFGIIVALFLTLRAFFQGVDEYRRIKDENVKLVEAKNLQLREHIHTNMQLESFAHTASDVLQHPIKEVLTFIQDLEAKTQDRIQDNEQEYLTFIKQQARQMSALTTDLLELSTLTTSDISKRSINTKTLLDRLIDGSFADRKKSITVGRLPEQINANAMQVHTLFKNVIENAFKYAHPERTARVIIYSETSEAEHTFIIQDNGKGINDEQKERAFLIFKRLQADGEGTGIGLATCKRIVEKHGGQVTLLDNPDGGLIFKFTLPR